MPARNAACTVLDALDSLRDQAHLAEILLVDNGSTDGTAARVAALNDPRIRILPGPRQGISAALNAGFQAARHPLVSRCDADDLYLPGRLAAQVAFLANRPDCIAVSGGFLSLDKQGNTLARLAAEGDIRDITPDLRSGTVITHLCTWLIRRDALLRSGGARIWFRTAEDVDLQFRLAFEGPVWHVPAPVYGYRLHDSSITHTQHSGRLAFYDNAARSFAKERARTGTDPLDQGHPPTPPDLTEPDRKSSLLADQMVGHLISQAWRDHDRGKHRTGFALMLRAVRQAPYARATWKGLAVMAIKSLPFRG